MGFIRLRLEDSVHGILVRSNRHLYVGVGLRVY